MVKRKGVGYIIEAVIATITLFVFVVGNTGSPQTQDWSSFEKELAGNDLAYTLKNTGDVEKFLKRQETGSLQTAVKSISSGSLETSGTINNLPITDISVGVNAVDSEQHTAEIRDLESSDECSGDLEEIESEQPIKRITDSRSSQHDGTVLYFGDTDPQISGGFNGEEDYDTMYVDNGTRCQFSSSEGPIYIDEFFKWNTSTREIYYDFKNVSGNTNEVEYYNATQAVKIQRTLDKSLNGIDTSNLVDTFDLTGDDINVYDLLVLRRNEEVQNLNNVQSDAEKVENFLRRGSVLFLTNLSETDVKNSGTTDFMKNTGLKWVNLSRDTTGSPRFTESTASSNTETYFQGLNGQIEEIELPPGGNISSSNGDTWMDEKPLIEETGTYNSDTWNATSYSMSPVEPSVFSGLPESACITDENSESRNLTQDDFTFVQNTDSSITYNVVNIEVGSDLTHCENYDTRALMIDRDNDDDFSEDREGPFLNGETVIVEDRRYVVRIKPSSGSREEGEAAELSFIENNNIELVNYRTSFEDFNGQRMARMAYKESYNSDERKLITSILYWLSEDSRQFGSGNEVSGSTTVHGSITENTYMPYKLSLRWE